MRYEVDESGCWNWLGYINDDGYGIVTMFGVETVAHRAAYMLFVGPVQGEYHVHHRCGNRRCVNPKHLEVLPARLHQLLHHPKHDACIWGHPFDEANTYVRANGERQCRACKARRQRERNRRLRSLARTR